MGGSPVRGAEKISIAQLNQARDIQDFQAELIRLVRADLQHTEVLFGIRDGDSKILQLPAWVRSHLERHPGLAIKLEQGAMVGVSHREDKPVLRPAAAARSSIVLIPIMNDDALSGVIGLISPLDGPQPSAEEIEGVRQLAHDAASILARLQEIDYLKLKNKELARIAQDAAGTEGSIAKLVEDKNRLDGLVKIGCHVQSNIAHELRTPLAAIRGYARMILDGRAGDINDTQRDYLRIINENTNRLINVANWMTRLADLSAQQFSLGACDLRSIWAGAVRRNQEALSGKSLKLAERIPEQSFEIVADAEKLASAFNRLIAATVQLSDSESTVTVEFSRGRDHEVMIKVSFNSTSVASDTLYKFFDRSINTGGTAAVRDTDEVRMSLTAVHEIVGMHGGRMFGNSAPGQDSTLLFTLPAINTGGEDKSNEQAVNISRR